MKFKDPLSGRVESTGGKAAPFWCLLLGPLYFIYKDNWFYAFAWLPICFAIAVLCYYVLLLPLLVPVYATFFLFLIPQAICAPLVRTINRRNYANKDWMEVT